MIEILPKVDLRFKKRYSNQSSSITPRVNKDRVSNPIPQHGNSCGSDVKRYTWGKYSKSMMVNVLQSRVCAKSKNFSTRMTRERDDTQNAPSCLNSNAPKKNHLYAL